MIKYHVVPITPEMAAAQILSGRHALVSYAYPAQLPIVAEVCESIIGDNSAFTAWMSGKPITNWTPVYRWFEDDLFRLPNCDLAFVPDVIDGTEEENDRLLREWPFPKHLGAPVWHMHESPDRIERMIADGWARVAIGSSGQFSKIGTPEWFDRMALAMTTLTREDGTPRVKIHGLRMLNPAIFTKYPFASCDSSNIALNFWRDPAPQEGTKKKATPRKEGRLDPPNKVWRGIIIAARIEAQNSPARWTGPRIDRALSIFD